jgi:hypothetical protein
VQTVENSPELLEEIGNQQAEVTFLLPQVLDLSNRVDDRGVMLSPETAPDFRKRRVRQRLAEIHRNLAGQGH